MTKQQIINARVNASVNCEFYNECRDAICHDVRAEMTCHECDGVMKPEAFKKELHGSRFAIYHEFTEFPVHM